MKNTPNITWSQTKWKNREEYEKDNSKFYLPLSSLCSGNCYDGETLKTSHERCALCHEANDGFYICEMEV